MIEASELTRTYGPLRAVDRLSFSVPTGAVCGFLGPNGAGKSTTIRMIAGLFPPDSGCLKVGGIDVAVDPLAARRQVGYLPESTALDLELRVDEYLRFRGRLVGLHGRSLADAVERCLELCGLTAVSRRLIGALSKGYRQRTGLAAALVGDPPLLVLDEPTVGLDPAQQQAFRGLLASLAGERTVLLSSHLLAEVDASCSWLVMISGGRLVATGPREDVMARASGGPVLMELRGERLDRFLEAVPALSGVLALDATADPDGWCRLRVDGRDGIDLREALIERAREFEIRIREVRQERKTLESVFLALSEQSEPDWSVEGAPEPSESVS
jgi:ABC-2 type transport system ATP-binding protein